MGIFNNTAPPFDWDAFVNAARRRRDEEVAQEKIRRAETLEKWRNGYVKGSHGSDQWYYNPEEAESHMRWARNQGII